MNTAVSWAGLAVSLLLVAVAAGISWWQHLGLQRQILIAATVARRHGADVPQLLPLALASFTAAAVVTLGVLFGLHVFPLTGRTLVPLAGMMIGNSMTATVLAGRRLTDELRDKRDEVEARLALGQASRQAATPLRAGRAMRRPDPADRNDEGDRPGVPARGHDRPHPGRHRPPAGRPGPGGRHVLVLAATATTTVVIALGLIRRLFTPDHRLIHLPAPADQ